MGEAVEKTEVLTKPKNKMSEGLILKRPEYRSNHGNTLLEYAVIGMLILVVSIGGIRLLGGNITSWMDSLKQNMDDTTKKSVSTQDVQQQQAAQMVAAQKAANAISSSNQAPPSLALTAASIPAPSKPIAVVGANGTTDSYANAILQSARDSLAKGSISQSEYNLIVQLANKGHDIATIQGLMQSAYTQSQGNAAAYAGTNLTFNGKSYTPAQLNDILTNNISDFSSLRKDASVLTGVLYDSQLLSTINDYGGKIINSGYAAQQQNQTAASFIQYQNEGIGVNAGDTHQQSATICTSGNNSDTGTHCSQP